MKKVATGGEDSYLLTDTVLSVADGVSWWTEQSGSSAASGGLFAEEFMRVMCSLLREDLDGETESAVALMRKSYDATRVVPDLVGTTTVSVAALTTLPSDDPDAVPMLETASLGDCVSVVLRHGHIVFASETLSHAMDYPFQLGSGSKDAPEDALVASIPIHEGDVVVVGSDGLFDNLFHRDIEKVLRTEIDFAVAREASHQHHHHHHSLQKLASQEGDNLLRSVGAKKLQVAISHAAETLATMAYHASTSREADTPYARHWLEQGAEFNGGKQDDITVVIGVVGRNPFADGERLVTEDFKLPPPYKNWP